MRNLKTKMLTKLTKDHNKSDLENLSREKVQSLRKMYETDANWAQQIKVAQDEENSFLKEKKKRTQMLL